MGRGQDPNPLARRMSSAPGISSPESRTKGCASIRARYRNLDKVTTNGDYEVTFQLKRPQPAFIALLASGFSPVYPCHVSPRDMRTSPIGTGPFNSVGFKD